MKNTKFSSCCTACRPSSKGRKNHCKEKGVRLLLKPTTYFSKYQHSKIKSNDRH